MNDPAFIQAMNIDIPPLPGPTGLEVIDCTGILLGNTDLELGHTEREGVRGMPGEGK